MTTERAEGALTDTGFWDTYWTGMKLPAEVRRATSLYLDEILDVLDRWLPGDAGLSVLEIGGAPGQYGVYHQRRRHYQLYVLDDSPVGCELTKRNLELLGIDGTVLHGDMFNPPEGSPTVDIVYSLGLIEHFEALELVIAAHLQFLRPGGTLLIGAPNFLGLNGTMLRWLAPALLATTKTESMDIRNWSSFESLLGIVPLFKGYVGGLEPSIFARSEHKGWPFASAVRVIQVIARVLGRRELKLLRRLNSRLWSGYVVGVYRYEPRG